MAKSMVMNLGGLLPPCFMETAPDLVGFSSTFRVLSPEEVLSNSC